MASVSGRVIDEATGTPVAGANVFVAVIGESPMSPHPSPATVTDRDGRFQFDALPAGRYHLAAQKDGFAPPMGPSPAEMFELSAPQVLEDVTVVLRRGGTITGRVLDPHGQPLAEVGVTALLKRLTLGDQPMGPTMSGAPLLLPSGQSPTNPRGEFRIVALCPGEYIVAANPSMDFGASAASPGATTIATSTFFPSTTDASAAQVVTVKEGETAGDLVIRLAAALAFHVSGVVVDEAGRPLPDITVMLMEGGHGRDAFLSLIMGPKALRQSDAAGRFSFDEVPAGSYTLRADRGFGGIFATSGEFLIGGDGTPRTVTNRPEPPPEPGTIEVTVSSANVDDLTLVLPKSPA